MFTADAFELVHHLGQAALDVAAVDFVVLELAEKRRNLRGHPFVAMSEPALDLPLRQLSLLQMIDILLAQLANLVELDFEARYLGPRLLFELE